MDRVVTSRAVSARVDHVTMKMAGVIVGVRLVIKEQLAMKVTAYSVPNLYNYDHTEREKSSGNGN